MAASKTTAPKSDAKKLTPMMQRYLEVKAEYPDSLLLFRMGDFYELFYEDAESAARVLNLTLTSRDKSSANPVPMAGFPYHALDGYLHKLIQAGFRASVCEQVEDPKQAKGLVRREVTRVVTPGTLTEDALLDPRQHNFLATIFPTKTAVGIAWLELSTGRFVTADLAPAHLGDELARLQPSECLVPSGQRPDWLEETLSFADGMLIGERPPWSFAADNAGQTLLKHFGTTTLEGFDVDITSPGVAAAGALLEYVQETQKSSLDHITRLEPYRRGTNLIIDEATRRSLELTQTLRDGARDGSLLSVIDETVSPMGARLLSDWLSNPLTDPVPINRRLDAIEELLPDAVLCRDVRDCLKQTYDLQRLTARIATGRASPRDLGFLAATLELLPKFKAKLAGRSSDLLRELETNLDLCADIRADIDNTLVDEPPLNYTDGGLIRVGYHEKLDELRDLARGGKEWIARYQAAEAERIGIPNLKVGFNKVFGYYLEVTAANADKVPAEYIRKQTLKNQERYITPALKEHEEKVLTAEHQANALEQELFSALRESVRGHVARLQTTAEILAQIDVLTALSVLAVGNDYCRPQLTDEPLLDIRDGRHPVLDRLQPTGQFVPNDVLLDPENCMVQLITGPNMAGKSTYIRQAALLTIMAQMGSFVPANAATIGIADRIFARVGASDELGRGQSTFMVEMTETARILNAATERSVVILDEIGRGTSTYDGISLAWAITEFLHDIIACRTLFATHYHELTELSKTLSATSNWNVSVHEDDDGIVFLHKIVEGSADKSYGIHVARLAGVPTGVLERADVILSTLEADHVDEHGRTKIPRRHTDRNNRQLSLFGVEPHPMLDSIRDMDINTMTPLAALEKLQQMKDELRQ